MMRRGNSAYMQFLMEKNEVHLGSAILYTANFENPLFSYFSAKLWECTIELYNIAIGLNCILFFFTVQ